MGSITLRTAEEWRKIFPGEKGLILMPWGREGRLVSFILPADKPAPEGKFRCLGVI